MANNRLFEASRIGDLNAVKSLIEQGADVHAYNDAALRSAALCGHLPVVKFLVSEGADVHVDNDIALRWAACRGYLPVVKFLVSKGADVHANNDGALRWASNHGHLPVVKFLVSKGANVRANGDVALRLADCWGHLSIVKFLIGVYIKHGLKIPRELQEFFQGVFKELRDARIERSLKLKRGVIKLQRHIKERMNRPGGFMYKKHKIDFDNLKKVI